MERIKPFHISEAHDAKGDVSLDKLQELRRETKSRLDAGKFDRPWNKALVETNLAKIDEAIETSKRNAKFRAEREEAEEAKRALARERSEENRAKAAEVEKREAFARYHSANPTASEAEFEAAWPALRERERAAKMDEMIATQRRKYTA